MYKERFFVVLLLTAVCAVTACSPRIITGSGDLVTETRQVSGFDSIALSGSGKVIITQGGSESLTIETDDNVMAYVKAEVEDGTLQLGFKQGANVISTTRLIFYVDVVDLTRLDSSGSGSFEAAVLETDHFEAEVSGSGKIQVEDLATGELRVDISGSGVVDLVGETATQDISVSGSGRYRGVDLCSESVRVDVSGSGEATVCATESLDADVSGSGSVNYYGEPSSVNRAESGSGKINNLGRKE